MVGVSLEGAVPNLQAQSAGLTPKILAIKFAKRSRKLLFMTHQLERP